jgi:hypothetical protein
VLLLLSSDPFRVEILEEPDAVAEEYGDEAGLVQQPGVPEPI